MIKPSVLIDGKERIIYSKQPPKKRQTYTGKYTPINPGKYLGNKDNVVYRSLWEREVMSSFDRNTNIIEWASEPFRIPYYTKTDKKMHGYWPDFFCKMKDRNGKLQTLVIEVKPFDQTKEPIRTTQRVTRSFIHEVFTYSINTAKWQAAKEYCDRRGWLFKVLTEKDIFKK